MLVVGLKYVKLFEVFGKINFCCSDASEPTKKRFVFSEMQKNTLDSLFKQERNPDQETKVDIAQQLNLDISQVNTYFMNARRRNRITGNDFKKVIE